MEINIENATIDSLSDGSTIVAQNTARKSKRKNTKTELQNLDAARTVAADQLAQMPNLKPNELKLLEHYMQTGSKADAYRLAFPEKAERWKPQSIRCEASKAFGKPKMQEAIRLLTLAGMFGTPTTLENHIGELRNIKTRALENGELGTARLCEVNVGQVSRLYVSDVVVEHRKPAHPRDLVKALAPDNPQGQREILEAIRGARAKPVPLDVDELAGHNLEQPGAAAES